MSEIISASAPSKPVLVDETALIEARNSKFERLNKLWKNAEADLRRFSVSTDVQVQCKRFHADDEDLHHGIATYHHLGFVKCHDGWRICFGIDRDDNPETYWKPITDCALDVRQSFVSHFLPLRAAVIQAARQSIPKLDAAIEELELALL